MDDLYNIWKFGGTTPEEFYYNKSEKGRKTYHLLKNDAFIKEYNKLPKEILPKIKERDIKVSRAIEKKKLIEQRIDILKKIKELKEKLKDEVDVKLNEFENVDHVPILDQYKDYKKTVKANSRAAFQEKCKELSNTKRPEKEDKAFLDSKKIFSRKDLRDWVLKNHPDINRFVSVNDYKEVIIAAINCDLLTEQE